MQLANPTQNISTSLEGRPQGVSREPDKAESFSGVWGNKAQKKAGQGFFAKLLEGLIAGGKNGEKAGDAAADSAEGKADVKLPGKKASKTARGEEDADFSAWELSGGEGGSGAVFAPHLNGADETVQVLGEGAEGDFRSEDVCFADSISALKTKDLTGVGDAISGHLSETREGNANTGTGEGENLASIEEELLLHLAEENNAKDEGVRGREKAKSGGNRLATDLERLLPEGISPEAKARYAAGLQLLERLDAAPLQPQGSSRETEPLAASRSKKNRLNVEFRDLRTGGLQEAGNAETVQNPALDAAGPQSVETEILVDLKLPEGRAAAGGAAHEAAPGRSFEDALAGQLRGDLSADIVQNATVIARNGGEGTIRLSLHPASLGDVKIRIEMAENKITGLIVVESDEALRAFERELPVLEKAFRDSGFSETSLEMSLAQDGWNFDGRDRGNERDFSGLAPVIAASRYDAEPEWLEMPDPEAIQSGMALAASPGRTPVNLLV